ncbi:MAG: hypothetical protein IPP97_09845 [Candidatus Obscuribacter sp.]|nr:hypothetical protein [Candidatus Obscuribacter sp.]MBP6350718.1 hypothetical protein [Candidatus Obscuribacter sp.]MBP6593238.1 hypothetical protein [Candidatus Obscuribacter sp.]
MAKSFIHWRPTPFKEARANTAKALALVIWTSLAQTVCGNFNMPAMAAQADNPTVRAQINAAQEVQSLVIKPGNKPAIDCSEVDYDGLQVTIWQQAGQVEAAPLVVFSHGIYSFGKHSRFLTEALARAGYIVAAPTHADGLGQPRYLTIPDKSFLRPGEWSDSTYFDREQDIAKVLQFLHQDKRWQNQIDWSKVAMAGHSLGGYTALGMAGGWQSWKTAGAFARTPGPCYFVEFNGAGHLAWTNFDLSKKRRAQIEHYCIAFLDRYLKDKTDSDLTTRLPGVKTVCVK